MNIAKKKIYSLCLAVIILFTCSISSGISVLAATSPGATQDTAIETGFVDVPSDHEYAKDVAYAREHGIIYGDGSARFNPDSFITTEHLALMLCRAFCRSDYIPRGAITTCYDKGWYDMSFVTGEGIGARTLCYGAFYYAAFRAAGVNVYNKGLYEGEDVTYSNWENYIYAARSLGIASDNIDTHSPVTRGEAIHIITLLMQSDYDMPIPDAINLVQNLTVERNIVSGNLSRFLMELATIPDTIICSFNEDNWKLVIGNEYISAYNKANNTVASGLTSYGRSTIYVVDKNSLVHEFGHYLFHKLDKAGEINRLFFLEGANARYLLGDYSQTNYKEYFAEAFDYWIANRDNETNLSKLKNVAPQTYRFFVNLEAHNWYC